MADQYLRDAIDYIIGELSLIKDDNNTILVSKLEELSSKLIGLGEQVTSVNNLLSDKKKLKELLAPVLGVDYFTDSDIERIVKLCTPIKGVHYFDGKQGEPGKEGIPGEKPKHKWEGTKIYFENPDGSWDKGVDLQGKPGAAGRGSDGGRAIGTLIRVQLAGVEFPNTLGKLNFASGLDVSYDSFGKFNISNPHTTLSSLTDFPDPTGHVGEKLTVKSDLGVEWTTDAVNDLTGYDLQNQFKVGTGSSYSEPETYDIDGRITLVGYWDTAAKGTKLYEKAITYSSGLITSTVTTDLISGKILTKNRTYSSGAWASTTKTIT